MGGSTRPASPLVSARARVDGALYLCIVRLTVLVVRQDQLSRRMVSTGLLIWTKACVIGFPARPTARDAIPIRTMTASPSACHPVPTPPDLPRAADENLAAHASWATSQLEGALALRDEELVLVDSGMPCDTFNVICRARLASASAPRRVTEAIAHFQAAARPFSWWLGPGYTPANLPDLLRSAGLTQADTEVAMALDLTAPPDAGSDPPGLAIRRVRTIEDLRAFAAIAAANWEPPDPWVLRFYERTAALLLAADAPRRLYLGTVAGTPVATAEASVGGGVIGLYNISTRPDFRRRGIGLAMTHAPLAEAAGEGYPTAILQAAEAGVGVYARLGFRPFGTITEFKPAVRDLSWRTHRLAQRGGDLRGHGSGAQHDGRHGIG